jgi:hypothetical protein
MLADKPGRGHAGPDWVDATLVPPPDAGFEVFDEPQPQRSNALRIRRTARCFMVFASCRRP